MEKEKNDVMRSAFRLTRAMMRRPRNEERAFPPGEERMLMVLKKHSGKTSAELCEIFDIRPSSMSEKLSKMEARGLIIREENSEDKRAAKIVLSEFGEAAAAQIESRIESEKAAVTSCFTEEETEEFCRLCDKLSDHLNEMAAAAGNEHSTDCAQEGPCGRHGHHGPHGHHGHGGPHGHHGYGGPDRHFCCRR